jgi:hypothetical protein
MFYRTLLDSLPTDLTDPSPSTRLLDSLPTDLTDPSPSTRLLDSLPTDLTNPSPSTRHLDSLPTDLTDPSPSPRKINEQVNEWMLANANWAVCKLDHGETSCWSSEWVSDCCFASTSWRDHEFVMVWRWYSTNTPSLISILLAQWNYTIISHS